MYNISILLIALLGILASANIFCNALEHLGESLHVSQGVTGSIFAAVGTALPETLIPILAILNIANTSQLHNESIGIGAILGAPFMLCTLSFFVMALSIVKQRGFTGIINPEKTGFKRDLVFFLVAYTLALMVAIIHTQISVNMYINIAAAVALALIYCIYLLLTIRHSKKLSAQDDEMTQASGRLILNYLGLKANNFTIIIQLSLTLIGLIYFAQLFITSVNNVANDYHVSTFILSLIIIPIATELPEKINSVIWLRKGLDTLAVGNISGAMVFQGSLIPIIGILFTRWEITNPLALISVAITLIATLWVYFNLLRNNVKVWIFMVNGLLYCLNLALLIYLS